MKIGEKTGFKILFVALLVVLEMSLWCLSVFLSPWLATKTIDELYDLLNMALLLVVMGVVIEEWELFLKTAKLIGLLLRRQFALAWTKARKHAGGAVASAGFLLLVFALAAELGLDPLIETRQKSDQLEKAGEIAKAETDAATANTKAAALLAENVELERALAPRDFNEVGLAIAMKDLPRVPVFVGYLRREEPTEVASEFASVVNIKIGTESPWQITQLPPVNWYPSGITVAWIQPTNSEPDRNAQKVAVGICEFLKSERLMVRAAPEYKLLPPAHSQTLPDGLPDNAVIIEVGSKPKYFWWNKTLKMAGQSEIDEPSACTSDEFLEWERQHMPAQPEVAPQSK